MNQDYAASMRRGVVFSENNVNVCHWAENVHIRHLTPTWRSHSAEVFFTRKAQMFLLQIVAFKLALQSALIVQSPEHMASTPWAQTPTGRACIVIEKGGIFNGSKPCWRPETCGLSHVHTNK